MDTITEVSDPRLADHRHLTDVAACDARLRIPMSDGVDSLNVATSLAVVASFAAARRGWAG